MRVEAGDIASKRGDRGPVIAGADPTCVTTSRSPRDRRPVATEENNV